MIVPRDTPARVAGLVSRVVLMCFRTVSRIFRTYEAKDRFLALQAPWLLIALLATWLSMVIAGFGLILWAITDLSLGEAVREAASSALTLGISASPAADA